MKKILFLIVLVFASSFLRSVSAQSPSDERKFEAGGHFSLLNFLPEKSACSFPISPLPASCLGGNFANDRSTEPGVGGRFGYNLSRHVAVESEITFYPRDRQAGYGNNGNKIEGLFGVKVGSRSDKFGLFAKARPGFIRLSRGDVKQVSVQSDFSDNAFQSVPKTNFAFDVGGVAEWYPSKRTIIRVDAGDTIIRFGARKVIGSDIEDFYPLLLNVAGATKHNFQLNVGVGFRF